jgi:hypothetical protein
VDRHLVSITVDRHSTSMDKPVQTHKLDIFSHSGQTFSFYGVKSIDLETQAISLTIGRHSSSMKKLVQTHKSDIFSHSRETFSFYGVNNTDSQTQTDVSQWTDIQFLSQWTDIQLLWRHQYRPTNQTFSLTVERHSAAITKTSKNPQIRRFL